MNEVLVALVVIAANTLVTYFLLNRQEKRLAKKAFEHEVKFQMIHKKRVETLEALHKKFLEYTQAFNHLHVYPDLHNQDREGTIQKQREVEDCAHDIFRFFEANRLFLPQRVVKEISDIYNHMSNIEAAGAQVIISRTKNDFEFDPEWAVDISQTFKHQVKDFSTDNAGGFLNEVVAELKYNTRKIEAIYKSVADTFDE